MKQPSPINIKFKVTYVYLNFLAAVTFIFGITYVVINEPMPYHQTFMGLGFSQIVQFNPKVAEFILLIIKFVGCGLITASLLMFGIIWKAFRSYQPWAWNTLMLGVNALLIPLVIMTQYTGEKPIDTLLIVELILFNGLMLLTRPEFSSKT